MFLKPVATTSEAEAIVAEVVNSWDLRSSFTPYSYRPEGEGEDDNDDNDDEPGNEGGEDDKGASGTDPTGDLKDPEKKRLHDEAANYRTQRNAIQKERDELAAWKKQVEDAGKSESDRLTGQLQDMTKERDDALARADSYQLELAFFKCPDAAQFRDPNDALRFIDLKGIKLDDEGEVPADTMKSLVKELAKSKPYLLRSDDDSGDEEPGQPSGKQTNGKKKSKADSDQAALEKKYPALRGRAQVS